MSKDPPAYKATRTLIFDDKKSEHLGWIDAAIWPSVGSVIEFGNPNRDAVVEEVRLLLGGRGGEATIVVLVDDSIQQVIPRRLGDRLENELRRASEEN